MLYDIFLSSLTIKHWLLLTSVIFSIGLYGFLVKQNIIGILISVEIMLNIVSINFVIFNQYVYSDLVDGKIMSIFIIAIAAIETVVGLAILILLFRVKKSNKVKYLIMKQR
jgi:NADH-quinone oxidoreductase subunit K